MHELTHALHQTVGWDNVPRLTLCYDAACARREEIEAHFGVRNLRQWRTTLINEHEFLAYLSEALHARPADWSKLGLRYRAPAFPHDAAELASLADFLQVPLVQMIRGAFRTDGARAASGVPVASEELSEPSVRRAKFPRLLRRLTSAAGSGLRSGLGLGVARAADARQHAPLARLLAAAALGLLVGRLSARRGVSATLRLQWV